MSISRTQTVKINDKGDVAMFLASWNQILSNVTVTGADRVELSNNNFGHVHTSEVSPHVFPKMLLTRSAEDNFHDLWFKAEPNSVLTITWDETYVPVAEQNGKYNRTVLV